MMMMTAQARQRPEWNQTDEGRGGEDLVRQRIHQLSKIRDQVPFSGDDAVQIVRQGRQSKKGRARSTKMRRILRQKGWRPEALSTPRRSSVRIFGRFICKLSIALAPSSAATLIGHIPAQFMNQSDIGLIGLAVMGENLVLNMESQRLSRQRLQSNHRGDRKIRLGTRQGQEYRCYRRRSKNLSQSLARPRKAQIMVKAGAPVDAVIDQLVPLLEPGDIIIDGGNSLWTDTQRREKALKEKGIHFFGVGVSGGEEGALKGPSIMPGGSKEGWQALAPIYTKIARGGRGRAMLPAHGTGRRRSLRENGAQRHRVRRHAAHLRGLCDSQGGASIRARRNLRRSSASGTRGS